MDDITQSIWNRIKSGELDLNRQQLFFSVVAKGFIYKLNKNLQLRGINIPHYILNTGDDIMYLEVKGQNHAIEPLEVSNENFVYSQIPRCMIQPTGINIQTDQLTSPYAHGNFQVDVGDMIYNFRSEFRRMPITYTFSLKYYLDNFIDSLDVIQQIIANLAFINRFDVVYLGQKIECSYKIPEEYQTEYMMEFDGITTDSKYRTISLDLEVDSNMPIVYNNTAIPSDNYIKSMVFGSQPIQEADGVYPKEKTPYFVDDPNTPYYPDEPEPPESGPGIPRVPEGNLPPEQKVQYNWKDTPSLVDDKRVVFKQGIILHEKGTINTSKGENSSDEITPDDTYENDGV